MITKEDVEIIKIDYRIYKMADLLAVQHMLADIHETPVFQTNEYQNKLIGYIGQIGFQQFLMKKGVRLPILKVNKDGSSDIKDFEIYGKTIDAKTLLWSKYWENAKHETWSIETGEIITVDDLVSKFFFLVPQAQMGIKDAHTERMNLRIKFNPPKDIYWSLFIKLNENGHVIGGNVYIIGWCNHEDLIKSNDNKNYFRFSSKLHTNIAIPLKELNSNKAFFA